MNSKTLSYLGVAAIVLILGAWWLNASRAPTSGQTEAKLYPGLQSKLDAVQALKIYGAGDKLEVQIARDGDRFSVKQRDGYAADGPKVRRLLLALEGAKLLEEKTSNPENYSAIGVQAVGETGATGARLELEGAPVNLIVGKHDSAAHATYVRKADDKTSWLIDAELDVSVDPKQWLQRDLIDIAANRIAAAVIDLAGEKPYSVSKSKRTSPNFDVDTLPKGRELNNVSAPNAIAQSLVALQLEDVRPVAELAKEKSAGQVTLKTFDGLTVDCIGYKDGERHWIVLKAGIDEGLAKRFYEPDSKDSKEDTEKSFQAVLKKATDEAAALDKKFGGWAYEVPSYKYDTLFKPLEQLLKKK